jgi:hypothetical protein
VTPWRLLGFRPKGMIAPAASTGMLSYSLIVHLGMKTSPVLLADYEAGEEELSLPAASAFEGPPAGAV